MSGLEGVSERAMRIYRDAFVVDMHNDLPSKILDDRYDPDIRHEPAEGHSDLPRFVESGITAQFLSAWVDAKYAQLTPDGSWSRVRGNLDVIHAWIARHPAELMLALGASDIRRAKREGKVAMMIGVEGGHAIEGSLEHLRELHGRGARYLTLTWNNGNAWAGSSLGAHHTSTGGLTDFGAEVIATLEALGMLVDVSHVSDETFADVLAVARGPVIASHSSARALAPHPRNVTDDQIRAIARSGGVVNVNFYSRFLDPAIEREARAQRRRMDVRVAALRRRGATDEIVAVERKRFASSQAKVTHDTPLSMLIDHIDHVIKIGGVDHAGLGSDFDGVPATPVGMEDITRLPRIAQALLDRGYGDAEVAKVLGGNMMRVLDGIEPR
ncbi:MAG: dipeptidase [Gemmatimonadota bacterium]|nr:dipeptidase [Gemmatimonadota bacterium]